MHPVATTAPQPTMGRCVACGAAIVANRGDMAPYAHYYGEPHHVGCAVLAARARGITGRLSNPRARAPQLVPGRV